MRKRLIVHLKPLHAVAVENPTHPGTPDVNYNGGWIELKWLPRWKRNCDKSPVLIEHFTEQQRRWLRKRTEAGGNAFLMLQVKREYLLFTGDIAAEYVGRVPKPELIEKTCAYWSKGLKKEELMKCLV